MVKRCVVQNMYLYFFCMHTVGNMEFTTYVNLVVADCSYNLRHISSSANVYHL